MTEQTNIWATPSLTTGEICKTIKKRGVEYKAYTSEELISESRTEVFGYLPPNVHTSRTIPGWKVAGLQPRILYIDRGQVLTRDHRSYRERRPPKTGVGKKGQKRAATKAQEAAASKYTLRDKRFFPWQQDVANRIHTGHHLILDVVTSAGKTWTINNVVTHETLQSDPHEPQHTALFVAPRSEILKDSVEDIRESNTKIYESSTRMIDTQTRSFCTYDDKHAPQCQIMCVTADNFEDFVSNELNANFIKSLKFLVFDEVHMNEVSSTMWWATLLPQSAQFVLLSATLGNTREVISLLERIAPPKPISVVSYHIRPVPLQRLLFKGCDDPKEGSFCSSLSKSGRMSMQINQFDPTPRDIIAMSRMIRDPVTGLSSMTREEQHELGQSLVARVDKTLLNKQLETQLDDAVVDPTPKNLYRVFSYLYSNGLLPALCFHTNSAKAIETAKGVVAYISSLEEADPDFKKARRATVRAEKEETRQRDKQAEEERKLAETGKMWSAAPSTDTLEESKKKEELLDASSILQRWRFPCTLEIPERLRMPQFIRQALECGIGVYLHSMTARVKRFMYKAFKQGKLLIVISDDTLAVGVNLPSRTTILTGEDMTPTLYQQMAGRSARLGLDTIGCVLPMFSKDLIKHCLETTTTPQKITVPEAMTYTQLVRLTTPGELGNFYMPQSDKDHPDPLPPGSHFPIPIPGSDTPVGTATALREHPGATLKQIILTNYHSQVAPEIKDRDQEWIKTIRRHKWHYHKLTNLIQTLPDSETMILMQMLINGELSNISAIKLASLLGLIFHRKEPIRDQPTAQAELNDPELLHRVQQYGDFFGLGIDFKEPSSNYFINFYKHNNMASDETPMFYRVQDLAQIEAIGAWIYTLRRILDKIAPDGDSFKSTIHMIDGQYMASCRACDLAS